MLVNYYSYNNYLGCLDISYQYICMQFSRYIDCFISHYKSKRLRFLITGKPAHLYRKAFACLLKKFGSHLLSHTVTSAVPSAAWVLTIVFGMGTGVTPKRIATERFCIHLFLMNTHN